MSSDDQFNAFLGESLAMIDEKFAKDGRPIHERPLAAAQMVVEYFVESVEGETKDGYLTKPWFGGIYRPVWDWYQTRYGEKLIRSKRAQTRGIVLYFGSPLVFSVPLVVHEKGQEDTSWVRFPKEVLPSEDPLSWLESPPPLDEMPQKRRATLEQAIRQTATHLRSINNDLNTADLNEANQRSLVRTVIRHLEKAAVDETSDDENTRSLAVWELQMACEKTMKAYLWQTIATFPETHDLRALQKLAQATGDFAEAKKALAFMPSASRVISWRYAQVLPPVPSEFQRMYTASLMVCSVYASMMQRKYVFNNFAIQLKKPAWTLGL